MFPLMRKCLALISLLWLTGLGSVHAMQEVSDSVTCLEYNLLMQARGNEVTGICIMNKESEDQIVGTVVNGFGIKAFDFSYTNGKARIFNVIGPLNKWYIKKVLKGDFTFILSNIFRGEDAVKKKRRISFLSNGDISVNNARYKINYLFTPITD